jgi:hypothetical protein
MNITSTHGHLHPLSFLPSFLPSFLLGLCIEGGTDESERKETSSRKKIKKYKWAREVDKQFVW